MPCVLGFHWFSRFPVHILGFSHIRNANAKEHKGRSNSSRPIGPYEAVCDVLLYLIYSMRNRTAKVKEEEEED